MTRKEWDAKWEELYKARIIAGLPPSEAFTLTHQAMAVRYGYRPAGEPGPPLGTSLIAQYLGVPKEMLASVWQFLDGKKTKIGVLITLFSVLQVALVQAGPVVAQLVPQYGPQITAIVGGATVVVGLLHKAYKAIYKEDHP